MDFILEISALLRAVPFSQNEPLKSTDLYCIIILKNKKNLWYPINLK
jgi:hypothetical protein